MKPVKFKEMNVVIAKDQPQYLPLPSHVDKVGIITTCWKVSLFGRVKLLFSGRIWIQQMTFKTPLQPIKPSVFKPTLEE